MSIEVCRNSELTIITLSGRFDSLLAKEFKSCVVRLIETNQVKLIIDMGAVNFIDSSGLGALVGCLKTISKEKGEVRIAALTPEVRTIFELTRLHRIFDMFETLDAALSL